MRSIERVELAPAAASGELRIDEWTLPAPSVVTHRQALWIDGDTVWAFGGNRGGADRFAAREFAADVWAVDLANGTTRRSPPLPHGRQSAAIAPLDQHRVLLLGGLGPHAGGAQSLADGFVIDLRRHTWEPFATPLPAPRTQFQLLRHDAQLWVLGGTDFRPDGDGGGEAEASGLAVLTRTATAGDAPFAPSAFTLPRPRRSFGAAVLGERLLLLGGLGEGFAPAGPADVLDLATGEWSELTLPRDWVSPQVAVLGDRLYIACGGTMQGQRFREDRSLWSWDPQHGFRELLAELPFAVRHVQMLAWRDRLLFWSANEAANGRLVLRALRPDHELRPQPAAFER